MDITIFPTFSSRWYTRVNTATSLLSLSIAIYFGIFEFVLTDATDNSGITFQLAILALAHALYGLTLFFALALHHPKLAGFISFLMFFIVSAYSFWITKDTVNTYFAILVIAGLLSGLYGWLFATAVNASVISLLFLMQSGSVSANNNFSALEIVIYSVISIMTLLMWSSIGGSAEPESNANASFIDKMKQRKKKKIKGAISENLSTEILINSITDGVAIINSKGAIETFNPSAEKITGWDAAEAVNLDHRSVLVLTDQEDHVYNDEVNPIILSLNTGEAKEDGKVKLQTKSKKMTEIDMLVSPIKNGQETVATVAIFRDVSTQRSEERQRADFISTASHVMRTPVAAIEGYLALAMNDKVAKVDTAAKGFLEKAHISTQHLGKLFQDLLTAAKSEDGRLTNNPHVVELGQLLEELIEGVKFTAEKKGLLMEADFGDSDDGKRTQSALKNETLRPLVYILVDPERLREVITNLFDNAVKYTEEGKITIGMHTEPKNVTIKVTDTGAGIPKDDIPHLFQKFYRVDNTATRQIGGTGLGLFISRKIVELYGGRVWVESELGEGSTFNITLPRLTNERAQELMRLESQKQKLPEIKSNINSNIPSVPEIKTKIASPTPSAKSGAAKTKETVADLASVPTKGTQKSN